MASSGFVAYCWWFAGWLFMVFWLIVDFVCCCMLIVLLSFTQYNICLLIYWWFMIVVVYVVSCLLLVCVLRGVWLCFSVVLVGFMWFDLSILYGGY